MTRVQNTIFQRIMATATVRVVRDTVERELYGITSPIVVAAVNPGRASGGMVQGTRMEGSGRTKRAAYADLRQQVADQVEYYIG